MSDVLKLEGEDRLRCGYVITVLHTRFAYLEFRLSASHRSATARNSDRPARISTSLPSQVFGTARPG